MCGCSSSSARPIFRDRGHETLMLSLCYAGRRQASDTSAEAGEISGNVPHARELFWKDLWTFFSLKKDSSTCPRLLIDLCWIHASVLLFILVKSVRLKICFYSVADIPHLVQNSWCATLYLLDIFIFLEEFNHQNQCGVLCFFHFFSPLYKHSVLSTNSDVTLSSDEFGLHLRSN